MNEQIKKLAEKANIHFSRVGILDGDPNGSARLVGYSKMEKFAELIVRDCMDVVDGYTKPRTFDTHYDAVEQIEALFEIKHNRVEE